MISILIYSSTSNGSFDIYAHAVFVGYTLFFFDIESIVRNEPIELYQSASGLYANADYILFTNLQFLIRLDHLKEDKQPKKIKSDQVIFGINFWPSVTTEIQSNYILDKDDNTLKHNQILFNSQIIL